jgi:hypothetical protein
VIFWLLSQQTEDFSIGTNMKELFTLVFTEDAINIGRASLSRGM